MSGEVVVPTAASSRVVIRQPDIDEYDIVAWCSVCGHRIDDTEGVQQMPRSVVDGALGAGIGEKVPIYGYRCDRHRDPHVLPAPASISPNGYERVSLALADGFEAAVPPDVVGGDGP